MTFNRAIYRETFITFIFLIVENTQQLKMIITHLDNNSEHKQILLANPINRH